MKDCYILYRIRMDLRHSDRFSACLIFGYIFIAQTQKLDSFTFVAWDETALTTSSEFSLGTTQTHLDGCSSNRQI